MTFSLACVLVSPCSWLLYEKPGFQGRSIALEEGPTDRIVNVWAGEGAPTTLDQMGEPVPTTPLVIGSIRLAVRVSSAGFFFYWCWNLLIFYNSRTTE